MKKIKFVLFYSGGYYDNSAHFNRSLALLNGMIANGVDVEMLVIGERKSNKSNSFKCFFAPFTLKNSLLIKLVNFLKLIVYLFRYTIRQRKEKKTIILFTSLHNNSYLLSIWLGSLFYKNFFVHERTEFPDLDGKNKYVYLNIICRLFDHIFVISTALSSYFKKYSRSILPMFVDTKRFNLLSISNKNKFPFEYCVYCGNMYGDKDGVSELIYAFDLVNKKNRDLKLLLIGDNSSKKKLKKINSIIKELHLEDSVLFTGLVNSNEIPSILCDSKMLLLCRPANRQALGGFPTKLGEYLSTGKPVVITDVGDVNLYLKDEESAFISETNSRINFSNKMLEVLSDYERALLIAKKGRKIAESVFNNEVNAKLLINKLIND